MKKLLLLFMIIYYSAFGQIDSTYYYKSKEILDKYPKSKIKAEHLYNCAKKVYDERGIVVPYKLAIAQAILETSLGNSGVGKTRNNPFSINSKKGYKNYLLIEDGVMDYYYFISKRYLRCKTIDELLNNFTNCSGKRYAKDKSYEKRLKKIFYNLI